MGYKKFSEPFELGVPDYKNDTQVITMTISADITIQEFQDKYIRNKAYSEANLRDILPLNDHNPYAVERKGHNV